MAQLLQHSIRHKRLLSLHQHLVSISLPSTSAASLVNESSERSSSFWQVWLPCKTLFHKDAVEKSQETENSIKIKPEKIKDSTNSKVCSKVLKGHVVKENVDRSFYQKIPHRPISSLQYVKDNDAVSEEQDTIETSTTAAGCNVESSAGAESAMKEANSEERSLDAKRVAAESGKSFNLKGHLESNSSNLATPIDGASNSNKNEKDWVQVLSKHAASENGSSSSNIRALDPRIHCVEPKVHANLKLSSEIVNAPADPRFTVCVEQHSIDVDVSVIVELLSLYGGIEGSLRLMRVDGIWTTFVNFKTEEAKEKALAARWLHIGGKQLPIRRVDQVFTTVVRISNASPQVTDNKVLHKCEVWGRVDNIKKRGNGIFDVYFKVRELPNITSIMDSLNSVTLNHKQWKVLPAPLLHPQAVEDLLKKQGPSWFHSQQLGIIDKMEAAINTLMIDLQDLQELGNSEG